MKRIACVVLLPVLAAVSMLQARQPSGAVVSGELRQWHKVTLTLDGPKADESATPNPFVDFDFFRTHEVPFWEMEPADALIGNAASDNSKYCLAQRGQLYLVYLPRGGSADLDLSETSGDFRVSWFDPRSGGSLKSGSVGTVKGGSTSSLGTPPAAADEDWLVVIRRGRSS